MSREPARPAHALPKDLKVSDPHGELRRSAGSVRLLAVDDELEELRRLERLLSPYPFAGIDLVTGGEEALHLYRRHAHQIVLTDLAMSPMHGFELIRRLQEIRPQQIIVVVSRYRQMDEIRRLMGGGGVFMRAQGGGYPMVGRAVRKPVGAGGGEGGLLSFLAAACQRFQVLGYYDQILEELRSRRPGGFEAVVAELGG